MDEYYEEPPPVPTFSAGTSCSKGMTQANASRASASKAAFKNASRASAANAAFIQSLPKNSVITSSGVKVIEKPKYVNITAIKAAEKRAVQTNVLAKAKDTLPLPEPVRPNILPMAPQIQAKSFIPAGLSTQFSSVSNPIFELPSIKKEEPKKTHLEDITVVNTSKSDAMFHKSIVKAARLSKQILSPVSKMAIHPPVYKAKVIFYKPSILLDEPKGTPEDQNMLCMNIQSALTASDTQRVLDEFKKYQGKILYSTEMIMHSKAVSMARENKKNYFTSM